MRNDNHNGKRRRATATALLVLVAVMLALAPTGTAHDGNKGTIKVHDDAVADPDEKNEPQVDCDFWIEGFNMDGTGGELVVYDWPPTGTKEEVMRDDWNGVPETGGDGHHFLNGPYMLPSGHYRVEAFSDEGHPGDHGHFAKAKMFTVDCEEGENGDEAPCPPSDISATANRDGSITVEVETADEADETRLYRAVGAGDLEFLAVLEGDTYLDTDTEVGVTYTYQARAVIDGEEAEECPMVEVTAIPVFPTILAAGLATAAGTAGLVAIRRRR